MDANAFWKRVDENNPYPTLRRLTDESGVDYFRTKKNRSDERLPNIEDAYHLAVQCNIQVEFLLTGAVSQTLSDKVYEYMKQNMPGTLSDILSKIEKNDGSSSSMAG